GARRPHPDADRARRHPRPGRRVGRRRRRLPRQAVRLRRAAGPRPRIASSEDAGRARGTLVRGPRAGPGGARGAPRRATAHPDRARIRPVAAFRAASAAGVHAQPTAGGGVGQRAGEHVQRGRRVRRLPAGQAGRAAAAAHGARCRLRAAARLMSIRARIALFGLGVVTVALAAFCALVFALLAAGVPKNQDDALAQRATQAADGLRLPAAPQPVPPGATDPGVSGEIYVVLLDREGALLVATGLPPRVDADVLARATRDGSAAATVDVADRSGERVRVHVRPVEGGYVV